MAASDMFLGAEIGRSGAMREAAREMERAQQIIDSTAQESNAWKRRCEELERRLADLDMKYVELDITASKLSARTLQLADVIKKEVSPVHDVFAPAVKDIAQRRAAAERAKLYAGQYVYDPARDVVERVRRG